MFIDKSWFEPFDSGVWGNVSEVATVTAAIVTLLYLRKTLNSQLEVQKMQQMIARIESEKFLESIRPKLSLAYANFGHSSVRIVVNVQNNTAKEIKITASLLRGSEIGIDETSTIYSHSELNPDKTYDFWLRYPEVASNFDRPWFTTTISYKDQYGTTYESSLKVHFAQGTFDIKQESTSKRTGLPNLNDWMP
ncbi:hypothetical protein [Pedobacter sp. SYP-B3415]|uniref:hypothetical protein n=1 Tax=Pedobacter sp. SYP-B3415 TaxID=2496641 RepID=UPI00101D1A41|nr:hypothetical protein [Pedobacter sp. SYP-B3415]